MTPLISKSEELWIALREALPADFKIADDMRTATDGNKTVKIKTEEGLRKIKITIE